MLPLNILFFIFLTKESVVMALKHAKFALIYGRYWWKIIFLLMYS